MFLAAFRLPQPEGVWNRVYHACCHLFIWPFNLAMILLMIGFGVTSDGIMSCSVDTTVWSGWMADAFLFFPLAFELAIGLTFLTLVVLRVLWLLRTRTILKGASVRLMVFLAYGYLVTLCELTFHWENRIRNDAINDTYSRYAACLASTLPWLRDSQCHIDGDHLHFSELVVVLILEAFTPWVAFWVLLSKGSIWSHWLWAFRVYVLRHKEVPMPFEESLRRSAGRRVMRKAAASAEPSSDSGL